MPVAKLYNDRYWQEDGDGVVSMACCRFRCTSIGVAYNF